MHMPKQSARAALFAAFVLARTLAKEFVMVVMSTIRLDLCLPPYWLPHAPYIVLAVLVFPIVGWVFAKLFRSKTVALSVVCSFLFLAGPLAYLDHSRASGDLFLIAANIGLTLSSIFSVVVIVRLGARAGRD